MNTHYKLKSIFYTNYQMFSIINIYIKFSFKSIMNQYTSFYANFIAFWIPVSFISDWNTFPPIRIYMSKSFTYTSNDSFGKDMRFLVQMMVISIWIIKTSYVCIYKHTWLLLHSKIMGGWANWFMLREFFQSICGYV